MNSALQKVSASSRAIALQSLSALLPRRDVLTLLQGVADAAAQTDMQIVQFASSQHGEGVTTLAWETAVASAHTLKLRTAFVDLDGSSAHALRLPHALLKEPTLQSALEEGSLDHFVPSVLGPEDFCYIRLSESEAGLELLGLRDSLPGAFAALRTQFDTIVIDGGAVGNNPVALLLSRIADGVVLVIEAERTRRPVCERAIDTLNAAGARLLGTVLNKRRFYIPRFVYRWL